MDYQAFGEQIPTNIGQRTAQGFSSNDSLRQRYGLTERDESTGLDDTWWRKHENRAGRWTSPDKFAGSMLITNPQSFNRFSYVENQPTNFVDPSGLFMAAPSHSIGTFYVDLHISWFDQMWDDHWGADNGDDFSWLYDFIPGDWRDDFDTSVDSVEKILSTKNPCSDFFKNTTAAKNALAAFTSKAQNGFLDNKKTGIEQKSNPKHPTTNYDENGAPYNVKSGKPAAYIQYGTVTVNSQGPFLSRFGNTRIGGYDEGQIRSQVLQILHEIAHLVLDEKGYPFIKVDGPDSGVSSADNTKIIKKACKTEIEASGKR